MKNQFRFRRIDDFHVHLREGETLEMLIDAFHPIGRLVAMGNLKRPVSRYEWMLDYYPAIENLRPNFELIPSIILADDTTPSDIMDARERFRNFIVKILPRGTTTNAGGVRLENLYEKDSVIRVCREYGVPVCGHWELDTDPVTGAPIPILEQEKKAIPFLQEFIDFYPGLRIIVEHASTKDMIETVKMANDNVAATLTAHHAILRSGDVFDKNGKCMDPYHFCKPVAKSERDREAVIEAMTSGNPKFFFGSDCAYHLPMNKMPDCPVPGIFAPPIIALPALLEVLVRQNALHLFEEFTSVNGALFYGLPLNKGVARFIEEEWRVPGTMYGTIPFLAGKILRFKML